MNLVEVLEADQYVTEAETGYAPRPVAPLEEPVLHIVDSGVLPALELVSDPELPGLEEPGQRTANDAPVHEFTPDPRVVILQSEGEDPATQRKKEIAFAAIVEEFGGPLNNYVRKRGGSEKTEDIVQEVFLRAFSAIGRFETRSENALSSWLYRIAHNLAHNATHRDQRSSQTTGEGTDSMEWRAADTQPSHLDVIIAKQEFSHKLRLLQQLCPSHRDVLLLSADGYTLEEISAMRGISIPTIKSRMFRGRQNLEEWKRNLEEAA